MNILFINPTSITGAVSEFEQTETSTPNMGILYMAIFIRSKTAANVSVIDMAIDKVNFTNISEKVNKLQPSIVGISAKTFNVLSAYKLSNAIKKIRPETIVLVGGAHPSALPEQTLREGLNIDAVVLREGENTLLDVFERMKNGYNSNNDDIFGDVPGIVYRSSKHGEIVVNKERELITNLDSLPFPDFSLVDYKKYAKVYNPVKHKYQHIYPIFASRGCPFDCTFCMPLHSRRHRVRSIENILDEVELLNKKYGAERIYFEDSLFCSKKEWFMTFCEKYAERGLHKKVQWGFETRIDTANTEMFRVAKETGCIYTFFGVESGSERVLEKANKRYSRNSIFEKVTSAKQAGIAEVNVSIILGLPYETRDTLEETLRLIEELPCDHANINILDVYPGTVVFEMADKGEGGLRWLEGKRMNWSAYLRGEPMVEINDINAEYLLASRERALGIEAKKSKDNMATILRGTAYIREYARTDKRKLFKKLKETVGRFGHRFAHELSQINDVFKISRSRKGEK